MSTNGRPRTPSRTNWQYFCPTGKRAGLIRRRIASTGHRLDDWSSAAQGLTDNIIGHSQEFDADSTLNFLHKPECVHEARLLAFSSRLEWVVSRRSLSSFLVVHIVRFSYHTAPLHALSCLAALPVDVGFSDSVRQVFESLDTDKSGKISVAELKKALEGECGHKLKEEDVKAFIARLDTNKDGELSIQELDALFK
ncbi:unnamed protein product [Schistocephalus solidus]|uniref:Centrin n=1 Tax=Schistocephalus solidus TaxID=70667 RepID=A0A183SR80_SCHSO|nr:unnamed protein product [Schistocephalus solidus]